MCLHYVVEYIGVVMSLVVLSRPLPSIGHAVCNIHTALATTEHFTGKYLVFMIVEFIYEENMRVVFHNVFSSTPEFIYIMMESENAGWTQDENDQTVVAGLACCLVRRF